jgi:hypothetical protein
MHAFPLPSGLRCEASLIVLTDPRHGLAAGPPPERVERIDEQSAPVRRKSPGRMDLSPKGEQQLGAYNPAVELLDILLLSCYSALCIMEKCTVFMQIMGEEFHHPRMHDRRTLLWSMLEPAKKLSNGVRDVQLLLMHNRPLRRGKAQATPSGLLAIGTLPIEELSAAAMKELPDIRSVLILIQCVSPRSVIVPAIQRVS